MTVQLSDLLAPTTLPTKAGAGAPASAKGSDGAFAQELAATQVGTGGTSAEATIPAAAPDSATAQPGPTLSSTLAGRIDPSVKLERVDTLRVQSGNVIVNTTPERLAELAPKLDIDPAIIERILNGTSTEADAKAFVDAIKQYNKTVREGETGVVEAGAALDPSLVSATPVAAVQPAAPHTDPALTATADNEEMALKIADEKRPYIPPRPDIPDAPQAKVQEGRAAATAPAPTPAVAPTTIETTDAASSVKTLLEQIAPRATANVAVSTDAKPQTIAPTVVQQQPASTPIPAAAQTIANTPHVTSIQGTVTAAADASVEAPVPATAPASTAPAIPAPTPSSEAAAPVTTPAKPAEPATNVALTPPQTEGEAIEAAMTALTKDKADVKAETPAAKPEAAAPSVKPETAAPQAAKTEAAAPQAKQDAAATADTDTAQSADESVKDVKAEAKPELQAKPADKPAVAEKPVTNEARVQQVQTPVSDKPILVDASVRHAQQLTQNLPAAAIPQIAGEMAARFKHGNTRFEIRLDPPELGRIDVRIEVDRDGNVHSRLMVEKSETLDLLKADQRALERALHEAGFKSDQNSLSFSLKDGRGEQKFAEQRFLREMNQSQEPAQEPARLMADVAYRASARGPGGIDMRV